MQFCPKCGSKQPENGGAFCPACGHKVAGDSSIKKTSITAESQSKHQSQSRQKVIDDSPVKKPAVAAAPKPKQKLQQKQSTITQTPKTEPVVAAPQKKIRWGTYLVIAAIIIVGFLVFGDLSTPTNPHNPPSGSPTRPVLTPQQIHAYNENAVFAIYGSFDGVNWRHIGSAFFITSTGIAVTNHHVMMALPQARARTVDGRLFPIIGFYSYDVDNSDIAIIQVDGVNFQYVTIGDSEVLQNGDHIFALGSPGGNHNTFCHSHLSRRARQITTRRDDPPPPVIYTISDMLEYISNQGPGSSGGALFNDRGEVIGVQASGSRMRPEQGWAVPISRVDLSAARTGRLSALPLKHPGTPTIFNYPILSFVPTFDSVSINAEFLNGGTIESFTESVLLIRHFDYVYGYMLAHEHVNDGNIYGNILVEQHGFIFAGELIDDYYGSVAVFFYHPRQNATIALHYNRSNSAMNIFIGRENVWANIMALDTPPSVTDQEPLETQAITELYGTWVLVETTDSNLAQSLQTGSRYEMHYFNDGTGVWGSVNAVGQIEAPRTFTWNTMFGMLDKNWADGEIQFYTYDIFDQTLTLSWAGVTFVYTRVSTTPSGIEQIPLVTQAITELYGAWVLVETTDPSLAQSLQAGRRYEVHYFNDSTGVWGLVNAVGQIEAPRTFTWYTMFGTHSKTWADGEIELYTYNISAQTLTLSTWAGDIFVYTRVSQNQ